MTSGGEYRPYIYVIDETSAKQNHLHDQDDLRKLDLKDTVFASDLSSSTRTQDASSVETNTTDSRSQRSTSPFGGEFKVRKAMQNAKASALRRVITANEFSRFTTIHGFKNVSDTASVRMKSVWMLIILFSFGGLTYQLMHLISNFRAEPTATVIEGELPKSFPPVVFCPIHWGDPAKLASFGLNSHQIFYLKTLFIGPTAQNNIQSQFRDLGVAENNPAFLNILKNLRMARRSLEVKINQYANGSFDEFLDLISWSPEHLLRGSLCQNLSPAPILERFHTMNGPCYKMKCPDEMSAMEAASGQIELRVDTSQMESYSILTMGDTGNVVYPTGEVLVLPSTHYVISAGYTHTEHANLRKRRCHPGSYVDTIDCQMRCVNVKCAGAGCHYYIPKNGTAFGDICSIIAVTPFVTEITGLRGCALDTGGSDLRDCVDGKHCIKPCKMKTYNLVLTPYRQRDESMNHTIVSIRLADPMNRFYIKEKVIYDGLTTISNIGGAIGLWCGGSIISVIEVLYFFSLRRRFGELHYNQ